MSQISVLPIVTIAINGLNLESDEAIKVNALTISQKLSLPALAEITFLDPSEALINKINPVAEISLEITIAQEQIFSGIITAVEYINQSSIGDVVRVRGYDCMYKLRKQQHIRSHTNASCEDILRELTESLGISIVATESGPVWPWIIQYHQSDLDFTTNVLERAGLFYQIEGRHINLFSLQGYGESVKMTRGKNLLEVIIEHNGNKAYKTVSASGWNPFQITKHSAKVNSPRSGIDVKNISCDGLCGNADVLKCIGVSAYDEYHAEQLSQAVFDRSYASRITVEAASEGDLRLRPGKIIELEGVHKNVEGKYVLTEVVHSINSEFGYICKLNTNPPEFHNNEPGPVALLGEVISVNDPEKMGRVKVIFPTCENVESDWLSVVITAGGEGKGLMALPDTGDNVLVLLINNELTSGIVLGGLLGVKKKVRDWGVVDGAVKEFLFVTKGGQSVLLDDKNKRVRIQNSQGSYCEINPGRVILHSTADISIEAPGKNISIKGKSIDFEQV